MSDNYGQEWVEKNNEREVCAKCGSPIYPGDKLHYHYLGTGRQIEHVDCIMSRAATFEKQEQATDDARRAEELLVGVVTIRWVSKPAGGWNIKEERGYFQVVADNKEVVYSTDDVDSAYGAKSTRNAWQS